MTEHSLQFIEPDWPAPVNVHAICTTRLGGVSAGKYATLNLGTHVEDVREAVLENRVRVRQALTLPAEPVWLNQVHGTSVVDAAVASAGTTADGVYATRSGVVCAILAADCLPIFLCNRAGTEIALLHAGWRGLSTGIVAAGLKQLRSSPDQLLAWLGPAISAKAYEVGDDVRDAFLARHADAGTGFLPGRAPGKWFMDLYLLARQQLVVAGVSAVHGGNYCTATQADLFFSHRRDGVSGRMASLLWLT